MDFLQVKFDHLSYIVETRLNVLSQQCMRVSVELLTLAGVNRSIDHLSSSLGEINLKSMIKLPTFACENFKECCR